MKKKIQTKTRMVLFHGEWNMRINFSYYNVSGLNTVKLLRYVYKISLMDITAAEMPNPRIVKLLPSQCKWTVLCTSSRRRASTNILMKC